MRFWAQFALCFAMFTIGNVTYAIVHRQAAEDPQLALLTKQREDVCTRLQIELEAVVRDRSARENLRVRMQQHFLDPSLTTLCLGSELPVDSSRADACWIDSGDDACYLGVAGTLLSAFKARH